MFYDCYLLITFSVGFKTCFAFNNKIRYFIKWISHRRNSCFINYSKLFFRGILLENTLVRAGWFILDFSVASLHPTLGGSDVTVFCLFHVSYIRTALVWIGCSEYSQVPRWQLSASDRSFNGYARPQPSNSLKSNFKFIFVLKYHFCASETSKSGRLWLQ